VIRDDENRGLVVRVAKKAADLFVERPVVVSSGVLVGVAGLVEAVLREIGRASCRERV